MTAEKRGDSQFIARCMDYNVNLNQSTLWHKTNNDCLSTKKNSFKIMKITKVSSCKLARNFEKSKTRNVQEARAKK